MLVIRQAQMRALYDDYAERWVVSHLRRHFPDACRERGETALDGFVHVALARARAHGFADIGPACRYVQLALLLGEDFDRRHDWAQTLLSPQTRLTPATRIELLQAAAERFLRDGPTAPEPDEPDDAFELEWDEPVLPPRAATADEDEDIEDDEEEDDVDEAPPEAAAAAPAADGGAAPGRSA